VKERERGRGADRQADRQWEEKGGGEKGEGKMKEGRDNYARGTADTTWISSYR